METNNVQNYPGTFLYSLVLNHMNLLPTLKITHTPPPNPCGSAGKESTHNAGDLGSIPGLGRSPGEGKGYPLNILAWRTPWPV